MISKEENILINAERLFAERGYDGTTTREISKAANVNISMISYYFGSKEKLLEKLFEYRMKEGLDFAVGIMENEKLNAWEKLIAIVLRYVDRVRKLKFFYAVFQREQLSYSNPNILGFLKQSKMQFLKVYAQIIEQGKKEKLFYGEPKLEFLHSTVTGTIFMSMNAFPVYRDFFNGDQEYEIKYYEDLKIHMKNILKYLLGYEENK